MILDKYGKPYQTESASAGWNTRRWDAADTDRLNQAHWQKASGLDINTDLVTRLPELRKRIAYELGNNPLLRGMLQTHKTDLIGAHGPQLNITALTVKEETVDDYAKALEQVWDEWWADPCLNQDLSGVDLLRQHIEMLWQCGEFLTQFVTDAAIKGPIKTRLHPLHPGRIGAESWGVAYTLTGTRDVVMGIERNKTGKAMFYHLDETPPGMLFMAGNQRRLAARNIMHEFRRDEPGQIRGLPWIASGLQAIADLRDFDLQVLDAARQAADSGIILSTTGPDVTPLIVNEEVDVPRRRVTMAPPGWTPHQMQANQPAANYVEYRRERHRDLGRMVSMPSMIARMDSSQHNFSSARFDAQSYDRSNEEIAAWLTRCCMNKLVTMVEDEASKAGAIPKERPARVQAEWAWGARTHRAGDPQKEAGAAKMRMDSKLTTLGDELALMGKDLETHLKRLQREAKLMKDAGLLPEGGGSEEVSLDRAISNLFYRAIEEYHNRNAPEEKPVLQEAV